MQSKQESNDTRTLHVRLYGCSCKHNWHQSLHRAVGCTDEHMHMRTPTVYGMGSRVKHHDIAVSGEHSSGKAAKLATN
jgi:hypothetical protein